MLTPLQKKKQTHYFNLVDIDKNGYLEPSDWEAIGQNLAVMRNLEEGTPEYNALMETVGTIWANLSQYVESEEKDRATLEEWLRFEDEKAVNCDDEWYEFYVTNIVQGVFTLIDKDGNGVIDSDEYRDMMVCFRVEPRNALAAFKILDVDQDGVINRAEFEQHVRDFHKSDDPNTPGNWLFGPIEE